MDKFFITLDNIKKIKEVLRDKSISEVDFKRVDSYKYEIDDMIHIFKEMLLRSNYGIPLFLKNPNNALLYEMTYNAINEIYLNIKDIEENYEKYSYLDHHNEKNIIKVFMCSELYQVFGNEILDIDYKKYRFKNAVEMLLLLSAYIINKTSYQDPRKIEIIDKEKKHMFVYGTHSHEDFRLEFYDLNKQKVEKNPFTNDILPFGYLKITNILAGYHSVETNFLSALLEFGSKTKSSELINNPNKLKEYINKLNNKLSNCADSGTNSRGRVCYSFSNYGANNIGYIHQEYGEEYYAAKINENNMEYIKYNIQGEKIKTILVIEDYMLDYFIKGLLKKASEGSGRTSLSELIECFEFYYKNYFEV